MITKKKKLHLAEIDTFYLGMKEKSIALILNKVYHFPVILHEISFRRGNYGFNFFDEDNERKASNKIISFLLNLKLNFK